jgi:hypothetical protein
MDLTGLWMYVVPAVMAVIAAGVSYFIWHRRRAKYVGVEAAYAAEYDFGKSKAVTLGHGLTVYFPKWMRGWDYAGCLSMVDSYLTGMIRAYPAAADVPWKDVSVYVHDHVGDAIVAGKGLRCWCYGWRLADTVFSPWRPVKDKAGERVGVAETRCLIVLPHEFAHILSEFETGDADAGHTRFFVRPEIMEMIRRARAEAAGCRLSPESQAAALAHEYVPWMTPEKGLL